MKKHHPLIAGLLALTTQLLVRNSAPVGVSARRGRDRTPGESQPAGSKMHRLMEEKRLGVPRGTGLGYAGALITWPRRG